MVLPVSRSTRRHSAERSIELMEAKSDPGYDALQVEDEAQHEGS